MKKATSKILMAAMSLVVAIGIATGTTFAWFTSNRTVTVASVNAQVTTGNDGLFVAIKKHDGTYDKFGTGVTTAQIKEAIFGAASPTEDQLASVKLDALTTADKGVTLTEEVASKVATWSNAATKDAPNRFIEFTLKFRTTVAQDIYLAVDDGAESNPTASAIATVGDGANLNNVLYWGSETTTAYGTSLDAGGEIKARAANAARVSFIVGGVGKVWDPNETKEGSYYLKNVAEDYRKYFLTGETGTNNASTIVNEVTTLSDADAKRKEPGSATALATTEKDKGYEVEVTVRLWLEGTDGDCLNSIFGDTLALTLVFNSISK